MSSVSDSSPAIAPSTLLPGRLSDAARILWGVLFTTYLALFIWGIPESFRQALVISDVTRSGLIARGISPTFPAYYLILLDIVTMLAFAGIAAFIVVRRSNDWMVLLSSLTLVGTAMLYTNPGNQAPVPVWFSGTMNALAEIFQVLYVYLFPTGRFIPRWMRRLILPMLVWRPAIWALAYIPNYLAAVHTAENYGTLRQDTLDTALMLALFAIGIGAQVYRYRRVYTRTQQLQTKWVLWGILIAVIIVGTYVVTINGLGILMDGGANELLVRMASRAVRQIALFMVPLPLALSILRYRLWDINLLVRRTLIYAPLTALLAGLFATLITLSRVLVSLTGQKSLLWSMVATIVVAIAAEPLRNFLQSLVDRRFKDVPDPQRRMDKFGERVQRRQNLTFSPNCLYS